MQAGASSPAASRTPIPSRKSIAVAVAVALAVSALLPLAREAAASTPVNAGYRDFSFGPSVAGTPTGEKPESKLWFLDGSWWGVLWNTSANSFTIQRFNVGIQDWSNTGTLVDSRTGSKADVLWDGQHLYVATHIFNASGGSASPSQSARIYRYTYNFTSDTYSLDSGFPVTINSSISETLVLDKDSTGKLWITWVEGGKVKVNRSLSNDLTWGTPFDLGVQGGSVSSDDISTVISMGNKVGIMWSNQNDDKMYFATHLDGNGDTVWQPREDALSDPSLGAVADDHINAKPACGPDGTLYFVTKTSLTSPSQPLNYILKRTSTGTWTRHVCGTVSENHTRAIILLNPETSTLYVFSMSDISGGREVIYMKSASTSNLVFPSGLGTPFIDSSSDQINNVTSTKQCVSGGSGLLVLASDAASHFYLHNYLSLGGLVPAITAFNPSAAPVGTQITITGARFTGATSVKFNGLNAAGYIVDSDSQIRATVPSGATTGKITVTTSNGTGTSVNDFQVVSPPTVASFTPSSGAPGTVVTIAGTGFTGTSAVTFGGTAATFTIDSNTQIHATVPSGAVTGLIQVTNPAGSAQSASPFTVTFLSQLTLNPTDDARVISSSPTQTGGTQTVLRVGGSSSIYHSYFKFNVVGIGGAVQSAKLRLFCNDESTNGGRIVAVSNNYQGTSTPWVESGLNWNNAPALTGATLEQKGSIVLGTWVEFDVTPAITGDGTYSFGIESASTNIAGYDSKETTNLPQLVIQASTAAPPTISSFTPTSGPVGTVVTITGSGYVGSTAVRFNGTSATFTIDSDVQIHATVPSGATSGPIAVTNSTGTATSASSFTVLLPPTIASFSPATGPAGTVVTIQGSSFTSATAVRFNGTSATFTIDSNVQIRATVPAGATSGSISVTNPQGTGTSAASYFPNPPTITSFAPPSGPVGTLVTITGTEFVGVTGVTFNGLAATFTIDSNVQIRATVPTGATSGLIRVTNPAGTGTSGSSFTVTIAPSIASFTPSSGPVGTLVTMSGSALTGATAVTFNGTAAASFTVDSDVQIRATVPAGAGSGPIAVTTAGGTGTSAASFVVILPPVVSGFTPTSGPVGTVVTVNGSSFTSATGVTFNGVPATFTIDSDTQIHATVPGGTVTGPIQVTNLAGSAQSAASFTVTVVTQLTLNPTDDARVVSSSPTQTGGTQTVLRVGGGASVYHTYLKFNVSGLSGAVQSAKLRLFCNDESVNGGRIVAVSNNYLGTSTPWVESGLNWNNAPALTGATLEQKGSVVLGTWVEFDVTAAVTGNGIYSFGMESASTNICGYDSKEGANHPELVINTALGSLPTISSFTPASGPVGTVVTIQGSGFASAAAVKFNGTSAAFTIDSDVQIHATVPAGATSGLIAVTNSAGTATSASSFTVLLPPTIASFSPATGSAGTLVTIQGSSFTSATAVQFNGTSATFTTDSDVQIHATVPAGATSGPISVTNPYGTGTSAATYFPNPPTITSFAPSSGPVGTLVTISGTEFVGVTGVTFNGLAASFTVMSVVEVRATVPAGATSGPIQVTNPAGTGTSASSYTVTIAPSIASFTPSSGPVGTVVTITGSAFTGATAVTFNGTAASSFTVDSDNQVHATVPVGAGSGPIAVATAIGTGTSAASFVVILPPVVSGFTPASGPVGTVVTVTGSSFSSATGVTFGGVPGTFAIDSDTQIHATVPGGAVTGPIQVTNPAGSAPSASPFNVTVQSQLTLNPTDDARVVSSSPTQTGGTTTVLRVGGSTSNYHTYLKFSVSGLSGSVQSAKLRLFCNDASVNGGRIVAVDNNYLGTSTPWVESGLNWNNAPALTGATLEQKDSVVLGTWVEFNVTPAITGNGIYSFGMDSPHGNIAGYDSKEGLNHPELVIQIIQNSPPSVTVASFTVAGGSTGSTAVSATDPDGDLITLTASLPAFATLNAPTSGAGSVTTSVTASPSISDTGSYPSSVTAAAATLFDTENFTITVTGAGDRAPVLAPIANLNLTEGSVDSTAVSATDPDGDLIALTSSLPGFAVLRAPMSGTGAVSTFVVASPGFTDAGSYSASVTATAGALSDTKNFTITVTGADGPPVLASIPNVAAAEGSSDTTAVSATDPDGDLITLTASLPSFATLIAPTSGTGTVSTSVVTSPGFTDAGSYPASVTATAGARSDTKSFTIAVSNTDRGPVVALIADLTVTEGQTDSTAVSASDADGDVITLTASLPPFATLRNPLSGAGTVATWIVASPGLADGKTYNSSVTATSGSMSDNRAFQIRVPKANLAAAAPSADEGSYPASITATSGGLSQTDTFTITVASTDQAPDLAPIADLGVAEGSADSTAVSAADPDGDTVTLTPSLPSFASLSATSGSGTVATHVVASPGFTDAGSYPSSVTATAGTLSDTESFTITVTETIEASAPAPRDTKEALLETNGAAMPTRFALGRIHPNPLRDRASIRFELPRSAGVTLRVYDVAGRLIRTLAHGDYPAGAHEVSWNALDDSGRRVGSGVYWMELRTQGFRSTRKLLLQR